MKRTGFSLIEFLVSLSLFSLIIMSTAQLIMYSFQIKRRAELSIHLAEAASDKLEYFKSLNFYSQEFQQSYGNDFHTLEAPQKKYIRTWKIFDISSRLKRIEIEVYSEKKSDKKLNISLFISKELGF